MEGKLVHEDAVTFLDSISCLQVAHELPYGYPQNVTAYGEARVVGLSTPSRPQHREGASRLVVQVWRIARGHQHIQMRFDVTRLGIGLVEIVSDLRVVSVDATRHRRKVGLRGRSCGLHASPRESLDLPFQSTRGNKYGGCSTFKSIKLSLTPRSHFRLLFWQFMHTGMASSHLRWRFLQVKHPVLTRFGLAIAGEAIDAPGSADSLSLRLSVPSLVGSAS